MSGSDSVRTLAQYAPDLPDATEPTQVLGPPDIESIIGITGGNVLHGEILPDTMFDCLPVPGFSAYRTPVENLYLCGAGRPDATMTPKRTQGTSRGA